MSVDIKHIIKLYGDKKVLDSVSFSIGYGELVGFLGPNGAGKSTLMKIITGFIPASSGEVLVNGTRVSVKNAASRADIGYLPENNPLYYDLYVRESLEFTAGVYKLGNKKKRVAEMVEVTGLGNEQHKKIGALSKGYRQRVGLAQALIHNPAVLILDEPTTGLDPNQLEEIRALIKEISREKTVMLSSHIMQEVEAVCNRVLIINKGVIIADGNVDEIKNKSVSETKFLIAEIEGEVPKEKLLNIEGVQNVAFENGKWLVETTSEKDIRGEFFRFAVDNNLVILSLQESSQSLENIFQELTRNASPEKK